MARAPGEGICPFSPSEPLSRDGCSLVQKVWACGCAALSWGTLERVPTSCGKAADVEVLPALAGGLTQVPLTYLGSCESTLLL